MIHLPDNHRIRFCEPQIDDLWFRQLLLSDLETMSYNHAWGGTIPFPKEKWKEWFDRWVGNPSEERFFRYITVDNSRVFIGEAAWHHDTEQDLWLVDIIIHHTSDIDEVSAGISIFLPALLDLLSNIPEVLIFQSRMNMTVEHPQCQAKNVHQQEFVI